MRRTPVMSHGIIFLWFLNPWFIGVTTTVAVVVGVWVIYHHLGR